MLGEQRLGGRLQGLGAGFLRRAGKRLPAAEPGGG